MKQCVNEEPIGFSMIPNNGNAYGGCSRETKQAIATLADRLAEKKGTKISTVTNWIRTKYPLLCYALRFCASVVREQCIKNQMSTQKTLHFWKIIPDFKQTVSDDNSRL